ncbi:MAG: aldo/keto reductase [Gammaproteobacteria bacterium]|nr:aldo/keto reductase [Gammaproteobacteria bacterium]
MYRMNRREFIKASITVPGLSLASSPAQAETRMRKRIIPGSGESIPVIGLGTWQTFDVGADSAARRQLSEVLQTMTDGGGSVVDSSPMYGSSEAVVGDLASQLGLVPELFMATKVWTSGKQSGIQQMERSLARMKTKTMDLMQVHNLLDAKIHLQTLADWKNAGAIRYIGLTHYHSGGYQQMRQLILNHQVDFIQINYSMLSLDAEQQLLPLAMDRGIAVLINRPYEAGRLFKLVKNRALPPWAAEFECLSWGQFFLKYLLANPAVTCLIPGTSKVHHMQDNLAAGRGKLPTQKQRKAMLDYLLD